MTYRKLLELYKTGELELEQRKKVEKDIERQEAISDYLYEQEDIPELNDIFEIAAKYATSIAVAHALSDANKRTGLAVALEYLSLNDFEITIDHILLADAMRDLVIGEVTESEFADILYSQYALSSRLG